MPSPIKRKLDDEKEDIKAEENENIKLESAEINQQKKARLEDESDNETSSTNETDNSDDSEDSGNFDNSFASEEPYITDEAEVGIIETVSLVNFMCHTNLEIRLGANVNFIIGRNGSGKSAILTGIIVGLGGKANLTNRGNSLKGFIKEGCNFCNVSITIRNRGYDAYKNDQYGNSIVVERRLTKDGHDSFIIKNRKTGRIVSRSEDELHMILNQFNIQIDNPVSILTQETAQWFLNLSDEKAFYTLFLKATELETNQDKYFKQIKERDTLEEKLEALKRVIPELHEEVKIYEEKYKDMQQLQAIKKKIKELKQHLAWALVKEKKKEADKSLEVVTSLEKHLPNIEKAIKKTEEKEKVCCCTADSKREEADILTKEVQKYRNEKFRLEKIVKQKKKDLKYSQNSLKNKQKYITTTQRDRQHLSDEIDDLQNSEQNVHRAEQKEKEQQIFVKNRELQQYRYQMNQIKDTIQRSKDRKRQLSQEMTDADTIINSLRNKLEELQAGEQTSLLAYGKNTKNIVKAIEQAHSEAKFHQKPVGPLGSMIKLKVKKWDIAVEQCLRGLVSAYACHDNHDETELKQILRKYNKYSKVTRPPIVVNPFVDHLNDITRNIPPNYTAVIDVLLIENHIVTNILIDQCKIQSVLLMETSTEAQNVIWQPHPPSIKSITKEGHEVVGGRMMAYHPSNKTSAQYLQLERKVEISECAEDLRETLRVHQDLQDEQTALHSCIITKQDEHISTLNNHIDVQDAIKYIELELQELKDADELPEVSALKSEMKDYDQGLKVMLQNIEQQKIQTDELSSEYQKECFSYKGTEEHIQVNLDKLEKLSIESEEANQKIIEVKGLKLHYEGKYNELILKINEAKKNHEVLNQENELNHSQALQFCEKVKATETPKKLQSKIAIAQKRIDEGESSLGKCEEIVEKYQQVLKRYQETKELIGQHQRFLRTIEREMESGARRYEKFQNFLSDRACWYFNMLLSQHGYVGRMKINHEKETIAIHVNVENATGSKKQKPKSLSAGERSFTAICFIMALWSAMEAPFSCLDEYDIYMDMLNRRISMDLLMRVAKEQRNRQFILVTSQDMSNVADNSQVKVIKLANPQMVSQSMLET